MSSARSSPDTNEQFLGFASSFIDIWAAALAGVLLTAGVVELLAGPLRSTHFFGFEWANERESYLFPGIAGRNIAMALVMLTFHRRGERELLGLTMLCWSIAGMSDTYAVYVYDGKKIGIHAFNTCMFLFVGTVLSLWQ